ncbi:MAG: type II methionyl aminopeptidase [Candidatus Methanofastidiosia archaeon]
MDSHDQYLKAGEIARKVKAESHDIIKQGTKYVDVANFIEAKIKEYGGAPAFPVNISVNNISAHYTPTIDDTKTFAKGDYVKVDIGAHVDGYISDTAFTVKVGESDDDLIIASKEALSAAIDMVRPGVKTNEIGRVINETITGYGFKPIENLTGHGLDRYLTHSSPSIPNVDTGQGVALKEGDIIAIEPFATDGAGRVMDDEQYLIFKYLADRPIRLPLARKVMQTIKRNYSNLPFAQRWLSEIYTKRKTEFALKYLVRSSSIYAYSVLKEMDGGNVSQAEHSMIITADGAEVYT